MSPCKSVSTRRAVRTSTLARRVVRRAFEIVAVGALLASSLTVPGRADAATEPWPEAPSPPKADVQWIASSMKVNGVPTRVMQFQSRASRSEVVNFYRAYWARGFEHQPSVSTFRGATVVGQAQGPYLMTVKVEDDAREGSRGLISVALVLGSKVDRDPRELPMPPGAQVLSVVESDDFGKRSRQLLLVTPQAPPSALDFYTAAFTNAGWTQVQRSDLSGTPGAPNGGFVVFARAGGEMQLSVARTPKGGGSTVLANLVTKDTGPGLD